MGRVGVYRPLPFLVGPFVKFTMILPSHENMDNEYTTLTASNIEKGTHHYNNSTTLRWKYITSDTVRIP